ncbi:MAG TPA: right-handed parallel beta-helix repeat-containing protein [Actinomycetota bacterium]
MTRRLLIATIVVVLAGGGLIAARSGGLRIEVPAGADAASVLERAPQGSTLVLLAGRHAPFAIDRRVTVEAEGGAVVSGPLVVRADGARLQGLTIQGGETGVLVREADDVVLRGVLVEGAADHGIEVVNASAWIEGCVIRRLTGGMAQGIEIRNANGRPRSVISGCAVRGGMEGIVSHVSRLEAVDNVVTGTTVRGISITEMSEGLVEGNVVRDALGSGIYCGDMSHCEVRRNTIRDIESDGSGITSRSGYGVVALYYATMRVHQNELVDVPNRVGTLVGSVTVDRFPLSIWAQGWQGLLPGIIVVVALALAALALARWAVTPWVRRWRRRARPIDPGKALPILVGGFAVQSFHMLEHVVQVYQVHVIDAEIRSGLAGQKIDTEWVHFVYNLAVLAFIVWVWRLVRPGAPLAGGVGKSAGFLLAAFAVQGYHMAEHTAKLVQHLSLGIDPAPGIIGGAAGLVWFHFGINLTVYVGMAIPVVSAIRTAYGGGRDLVVEPGR